MPIAEWTPIAKGLATTLPGLYRLVSTGRGGGTSSAQYCLSIWAKHLALLHANGMAAVPHTVAELGPGNTLGVGICALLSGASKYYALDVDHYSNPQENLRLLGELVAMFRSRCAVGTGGWPDFSAHLDAGGFPAVLAPELLARTLTPHRIDAIRRAIVGDASELTIQYVAPWTDETLIVRGSVDLIMSHSVLEHVADLEHTIRCCAAWLKPDGWMSHQVDFTSHGVTKAWNGHWQYPEWAWRMVVGGRPYLINRMPADAQLHAMRRLGFTIAMEMRQRRTDGLPRERLDEAWRGHAVDCASVYVQARPV